MSPPKSQYFRNGQFFSICSVVCEVVMPVLMVSPGHTPRYASRYLSAESPFTARLARNMPAQSPM